MYGHSVTNTLAGVTDQCGSIAVDLLCIPGLRGVRDIFCEVHLKNVGPLLQVLGEIGVCKRGVCGSMPTKRVTSEGTCISDFRRYLHQHLRISSVVSRVVAAGQVAPLLSSLSQLSVRALVAPAWSSHASCSALNVEAPVWNA